MPTPYYQSYQPQRASYRGRGRGGYQPPFSNRYANAVETEDYEAQAEYSQEYYEEEFPDLDVHQIDQDYEHHQHYDEQDLYQYFE